MSNDIDPILEDWDYAPGKLRVRRVDGVDGRPKIQVRMDLGVMQMEWRDRPDGSRPHDAASLLEHYQQQLAVHQGGVGSQPFRLSRADCWALGQEAMQYYWRRISFFELKEYALAEADAEHNLRILDLCESYAEHPEDRQLADEYRVFVTSHRVQAHVLQRLEGKAHAAALQAIQSGIAEIERILHDQGEVDPAECAELRFLRDWESELVESRPLSPRDRLQVDLKVAVEGEQFELAAALRDRLRQMEQDQR